MFSIKTSISCFTLLNVFIQIKSLVELSSVEDNYIAPAEAAIEHTMDKLFNIFKITQEVKHKPRLKQYSTINNFFSSITLTDCNNLKEIAKLTRVNNIDNNTQHFIAQINEVLNEDDKSYESNDINNNYVSKYINMFIRKLQYLKEIYVANRNSIINGGILKYSDDGGKSVLNVTKLNNYSKALNSDENEFWQPSGRRIYQGIRTTIKRFPFMASVLFFKRFQCAGSIIKNDVVITSASCLQLAWNNRFFRENPSFLSVQVGSDTYEGGGDNIGVFEINFYPDYDPKTLRNNIALLRLTRRINFKNPNNRRIKKIDFDRNPWPMPEQCPKITVVGWGAKDGQNVISDVFANKLSYSELDYYTLASCEDIYSKDYVTEKNFCAGFLSKGGGACNRDAGAPGVIDNTLYGVVSFGSPICGAADAPTVFTKLGFYADWIEMTMEQRVPSKQQITSTPAPNTLFSIDLGSVQPERTLKIFPIMTPTVTKPIPIVELDRPDVAEESDVKYLLRSILSNDEIEEYLNKSNEEINKTRDSDINDDTNEDKHKFIQKPNQNSKTVTKSITKRKTMSTPSYLNLKLDSSDETELKKEVTRSENIDDDDNILEGDIMTLIDKLDIDDILKPVLPEQSQRAGEKEIKVKTENKEKETERKTNRKHKEKQKESVKIAPSGSNENNLYFGHKPEDILNYLFFSNDNKDKNKPAVVEETELSEETNEIKDNSTIKQELNTTNKNEKLSEQSIYEMVSLAIEEETKRNRKEKS